MAMVVVAAAVVVMVYLLPSGSTAIRRASGSELEMFKQEVAYPRRIEPSRPVTVVIRHRCGSHAEQTRKWV